MLLAKRFHQSHQAAVSINGLKHPNTLKSNALLYRVLTLPMLWLLPHKAQGRKEF